MQKNVNSTYNEILNDLQKAQKVLIFTHLQIDGDCLGSAVAMCAWLRQMGKEAHVLLDEPVPAYLCFLDDGYTAVHPREIPGLLDGPYLSLSVDCSDIYRFETLTDVFFNGTETVCIDHHGTNTFFAQKNCVEPCGACGEIVYRFLQAVGAAWTPQMATALYTAIVTDTGEFAYSNTTPETHRIAADLLEKGADFQRTTVEVYQSVRKEKILLQSRILNQMELFLDGKAAMAWVTKDMLGDLQATMDETEGVVEELRSIRGVEVAIFVKEAEPGLCRVSTRAKTFMDVSAICVPLGGGGHAKAAGCTLHMGLTEALQTVKAATEEQYRLQAALLNKQE